MKARWEVPLAILAWVRDGTRPSPELRAGKHGYRVPYRGLSGLDGGSGNIPLQLALAHLAAGVPEALEYLEARAEDELRHGLGGGEQLSPAYEHLSFWVLIWWTAWEMGHERLARLSGAWVERHLLVSCLLGRLEHGVLAVYAPGMRADKGADRSAEEAIIAHLLGIDHPLSTNMHRPEKHWWWGGILLEAVQEAEGIERVADRARTSCLRLLDDKRALVGSWDQAAVAYHVPVEVAVFGPQEWLAWVLLGGAHWTGHPQDPAMVWGGVIGGKPTVGLPYEIGEDPAEGGWMATGPRPPELGTMWRRGGHTVVKSMPDFPRQPLSMVHLREPAADPLADLPPLPRGNGPSDPEPPPEDPEKEDPMPEPEHPWPTIPADLSVADVLRAPEEALLVIGAAYGVLAQNRGGKSAGELKLARLYRAARRHQKALQKSKEKTP